MQLINLFQVVLLIASQTAAAPLTGSEPLSSNAANDLIKRANPAPVSCGPTTDQRAWPLESVQNAFNALVSNGNLPNPQKPAAGGRYYPRQYGQGSNAPTDASVVAALDAIPGCATTQTGFKYFEFPLTDPTFTGGDAGSQGPDRVVAISANIGPGGTRTFTYCLAMTHRGAATNGGFDPCTNAP